MVYSLTYRRPPHVDSARSSVLGNEKAKSIGETSIDSQVSGGSGGVAFGIPDALSFDRIITGGTCPVSRLSLFFHPCSPGFNITLLDQQDFGAAKRPASILHIYLFSCAWTHVNCLANGPPSSHVQHATS